MLFYLNGRYEFFKLISGQAQSYVVASKIHTVRARPAIHMQVVSASNPRLSTPVAWKHGCNDLDLNVMSPDVPP